jgi:hypothetical protein
LIKIDYEKVYGNWLKNMRPTGAFGGSLKVGGTPRRKPVNQVQRKSSDKQLTSSGSSRSTFHENYYWIIMSWIDLFESAHPTGLMDVLPMSRDTGIGIGIGISLKIERHS